MRVVSLVPSLTETLVECGVDVVGRTRFCIHPAETVKSIPVVGGTKDAKWDAIAELKPDLVVLDREENTREMADACPVPWHATHITSVANVGDELAELAGVVNSSELQTLSRSWRELAKRPPPAGVAPDQVPGIQDRIGQLPDKVQRIRYMIWRDPWMQAGSDTFIHSMLQQVGLTDYLETTGERYPQLGDYTQPESGTFYLFSTEPYPFARQARELESLGFNGAIVDGEFYSWFGVRSLRKLHNWGQSKNYNLLTD